MSACLLWAAETQAQRIIYDAKRDGTAQEAVNAAKDVTSGAVFAAMLKNVDAQAKLEVETITAFVHERMRARLNAFEVWQDLQATPGHLPKPGVKFDPTAAARCRKSVDCQLAELRIQHKDALASTPLTSEQLTGRLDAIKARIAAVQAELKVLQQTSQTNDPFIVRAFEALEDPGADLLEYAQKLAALGGAPAKGVGRALTAIEEGLDQILGLYKAIASIWRGQQAVSVDPASLRPPPQQIDLQLLAVEQAHWKTVARIKARKELEVGAALAGVEEAIGSLGEVLKQQSVLPAAAPRPIEATLREAAGKASDGRQALRQQWEALHGAASAIAQLDTADALATLRLSDEERRYSIRRSTVNISTYDLTIQAAAQRLALYWKGGIKATELAQFVFYVTNSIALPAIAIKE